MTLIKELQITITISDYIKRSSNYFSNHDYVLLDNLFNSSYSNLFRSDLKNLKVKDPSGNYCSILYIPEYASQPSCMLVRIPVSEIYDITKLTLAIYDKSTSFSSSLSVGGEVQFFDANNDTFSDFFESTSGISILYDTIDSGKVIRSQFVPQQASGLFTKKCSGYPIPNGRVVAVRFKRATGCVSVNDSYDYPYPEFPAMTSSYLQVDYNLTGYAVDMQVSTLSSAGGNKDYCMLNDVSDLVMCSSWDAWNSGSDDDGEWKQCHIHTRASTGFSDNADCIEGSLRNNLSKIYETNYHEVMINSSSYSSINHDEFNYVDLKWLLVFPSPIFAFNNIPTIVVEEKTSKKGIRLFKGSHEYSKACRGKTLLWNADNETMDGTGLYLPDKIVNNDWDWVF